MKKKATGMGVAIVLALVGTLLLVAYVQSAHEQAGADERVVDVYVVTERIERASGIDVVQDRVQLKAIPAGVRVDDAVTDLSDLSDLYTTVELLPGEQLVHGRFAGAGDAARGDVPDGMLQVSVALDIDRVVGGKLRAGDTVGVLLSYEPPVAPYLTHLELDKIVVTDIQYQSNGGSVGTGDGFEQEGVGEAPPQGKYIVTLAVTAPQAEQVVHAADHGQVWLTAQPADSSEAGTKVVTPANVYTEEIQ